MGWQELLIVLMLLVAPGIVWLAIRVGSRTTTPQARHDPAPPDTVEERLRELQRLRDEGLISSEQYRTRSALILKDL